VLDVTLPDAGTDTTIAGTAPTAGTTIVATKDSDWTTLYFYDATADGGAWNATTDIIFINDGNIYYDDTKDTKLAGATTENSLGASAEPGDWTLFFYDKTDTDAWDSANDWIGQDSDSDGVYTSAADSQIDCDGSGSTGAGTCTPPAAGTALVAFAASDYICTDSLTAPTIIFIEGDATKDCITDATPTVTNILGTAAASTAYSSVTTQWAYRQCL
jgi:hypothetical protein